MENAGRVLTRAAAQKMNEAKAREQDQLLQKLKKDLEGKDAAVKTYVYRQAVHQMVLKIKEKNVDDLEEKLKEKRVEIEELRQRLTMTEFDFTQLGEQFLHLQQRQSNLISQFEIKEKIIDNLSEERDVLAKEVKATVRQVKEEKKIHEDKVLQMEAASIHSRNEKNELAELLDAQMQLVKSMGDKMKEKEKRIEQLENLNKELVNSVYELNKELDAYGCGIICMGHGQDHSLASIEQSREGDDVVHVDGESWGSVDLTAEESSSQSYHDQDHDQTHSHSHHNHSSNSRSLRCSNADEEQDHSHESSSPSALENNSLRIQCENSTYQEELDKLSSPLKTKTADASTVAIYKQGDHHSQSQTYSRHNNNEYTYFDFGYLLFLSVVASKLTSSIYI